MPSYVYTGVTAEGEPHSGRISGASEDEARSRLRSLGVYPAALDADRASRPLPVRELAAGLDALASLVEAGVPLPRAVTALGSVAPAGWRDIAPDLAGQLARGEPLGRAVAATVPGIPQAAVGILEAADGGPATAEALRRVATLTERRARTAETVRGALTYPLILALSSFAACVVILGWVVPRFEVLLADLGQDPPAMTRGVMAIADAVKHLGLPLALLVPPLFLLARLRASSDSGRRAWHTRRLALPVAGPLYHRFATAHVCSTLSALLSGGRPIGGALELAGEASGDLEVIGRIMRARARLSHGESVSDALVREQAFTESALELVRVGDGSGRLAEMLERAGRLEAERGERDLIRLTALVEPALILVVALVVALVAAGLLQAVYAVRPGL